MAAAAVLAAPVVALSAVPAGQFRHWQWIALAVAAPVVGWAVRRRPPGAVGALAVAGPVAALGWSGYLLLLGGSGVPGARWSLTGGAPLACAAVLGALALLSRDLRDPTGRALTAVVLGSAVAALGFGLGRGAGPDAVAAATAVLVAGSPAALLLIPRRARRLDAVVVPEELLTTGELEVRAVHLHGDATEADVRRFAAALHAAEPSAAEPPRSAPPDVMQSPGAPLGAEPPDTQPPGAESPDAGSPDAGSPARAISASTRAAPRAWTTGHARAHEFSASRRPGPAGGGDAPGSQPTPVAVHAGPGSRGALGRAVVAAATGRLPGVSDPDGDPGTGLRGVVSELHGGRVVAHAVLVGPPAWLAEHGVAAPHGAGPDTLAVAWDGEPRGWLEVEETMRPGAAAATAELRRRGVEVVPAGHDQHDTLGRLSAAGRAVAVAPNGSKATLLPPDGSKVALLQRPGAADLAAVGRAVRRQHRRVLLRQLCLVLSVAAAVGGAAAAFVGLLNPATAVAVPVGSAVLVVAGTRRHHPFGATA